MVLLTSLSLAVAASSMLAPQSFEKQQLSPSPVSPFRDRFGESLAIWRDVLLVGAGDRRDSATSVDGGSALVYRMGPGGWQFETELRSADYANGDTFGRAVAAWDDLLIVSAPGADGQFHNAGAAYVFRYEPGSRRWLQEGKLFASDGWLRRWYGDAVAIHGDLAVVGSPGDEDHGAFSGAVYVYRYNPQLQAWVEEQKLVAGDARAGHWFGDSVALWGEVVVVGAPYDDDLAFDSGAAYVFRYDPNSMQWVEEQKLQGSSLKPVSNHFGWSVSISFDAILVGAPREKAQAPLGGGAHVFRYDSQALRWIEEAQIGPIEKPGTSNFGQAVQLSGTTALISAPGEDDRGFDNSGCAFVFQHQLNGTWIEIAKLAMETPISNVAIGEAIAHWGDQYAMGDRDLGGHGMVFAYDSNFYHLRVGSRPLIAGQSALFTQFHGTPNRKALLFHSTKEFGPTVLKRFGVELDLKRPMAIGGAVRTDGSGRADWFVPIPLKSAGYTVRLQAAQDGRRTPPQAVPIQ